MKHLFLAALATIGLISCQNGKNTAEKSAPNVIETTNYLNFGDSTFSVENPFTAAEVVKNMASDLDTVWAVVGGPITQVCTTKGCWMATAIDSNNNLFVDYDYEFLLPTNCQGQDMIMSGYAYWDSTSVAQLRHYAEDRGASEEEIAAITEPVGEVMFKAKGVKIVLPDAE
jgi:hypothetical protein